MKYVLFVCTQNAGRSQMAQAFFERYARADMRVTLACGGRCPYVPTKVRLAKMLPTLFTEFEGRRTPEQIRECADAVLTQFDDARIRSHVPTLAQRRTRECLQADYCYELEAV